MIHTQTLTLKRERILARGTVSGPYNSQSRGATLVQDTESDVTVELTIDLERLATLMGTRAFDSKGGKAQLAGSMIKARVVKTDSRALGTPHAPRWLRTLPEREVLEQVQVAQPLPFEASP